jgi:hypothetical protein
MNCYDEEKFTNVYLKKSKGRNFSPSNSVLKHLVDISKVSQVWWCISIIPAFRKAEAGES